MSCHYAFHIYDMINGYTEKVISRHFSYKEALKKYRELEAKNDGTHYYVIL